jgi:NADPH2:quinone reductase
MLSEGDFVSSAEAPPSRGATVPAAIVDGPGGEPRLGSIELAARVAGSTLVEVLAAPINPLDLLVASGTFHSVRHEAAYVPGSEFVGVVLESDILEPGARVYGECHPSPQHPGAFATRVLVADEDLLALPDGLDPVIAAAVGNSGVAAYLPLVEVARLRAGDCVLVLGATGTVGQLAVQVARGFGAGRVIGVGRDADALKSLQALGADAVVQLRKGESVDDLAERIIAAAGPVDLVFDAVYGEPLQAALQACARGARIVNVGHGAGPIAQIPAGLLRGRQLTVSGFAGLHTTLLEKQAALQWLWSAVARAALQLRVKPISLEELPEAWRAQAGSPHAKLVVVPA